MTLKPITGAKIVNFGQLHRQYTALKGPIDAAIEQTLAESTFIRGPAVECFETSFANLIGVGHCVSCGNGTDALYIAMKSLGVKPGDEVIVPAMTWISTSEAVSQAGGIPIFCDIDAETNTIDPDQIESLLSENTVGIVPVHLYGHSADMKRIMQIANSKNLWVVEDCAQAHLTKFNGKYVGTFGAAATFSFYPGKNLGAMGDAGAVVTNDHALSIRMAKFARHGGLVKGTHDIEGINSRLDGLQAAILNVKMPYLPDWTKRRRQVAEAYNQAFAVINGLHSPTTSQNVDHSWHLFCVQTRERSALRDQLLQNGISTSINYPKALHQLPCYEYKSHSDEEFPNASSLANCGLCLPLYPELELDEIQYVIRHVLGFFNAEI